MWVPGSFLRGPVCRLLRCYEALCFFQTSGRANLIESLLNFHSCQLPFFQKLAVEFCQVGGLPCGHSRKSLRGKSSQTVINVVHPRGPVFLAVGQNSTGVVLHVAAIPLPRV